MTLKFATTNESYAHCEEAIDEAAVDFPLPTSEDSVF
jgi:hypothetical protein